MAKVKIEVLDAVVDGQAKGSILEIETRSADHLESIGYVKKVANAPKKAKPKPKAKTKTKPTEVEGKETLESAE